MFEYTKEKFFPSISKKSPLIIWKDVIDKLDQESRVKTSRVIPPKNQFYPSFICHNDYYPNTIESAYKEIEEKFNAKNLHMYISFSESCSTFGRHKDSCNVLIIQSIGKVSYYFDTEKSYTLNPGDGLIIPKGIYHNPRLYGHRVTLSFEIP